MSDTAPRGLRNAAFRTARRAALAQPHMAPLAAFAERLRADGRGQVPDFDPADGGTAARLLFLLEKPGPMTVPAGRGRRPGSGFVSRDNDDPTAEAAHGFFRQAQLDRADVVVWNVVPWWNGTTRVTAAEMAEGLDRLAELLDLLPRLEVAVTVGRRAERAGPLLRARGLATFASAHPSGQVRAAFPGKWAAISAVWRDAGACLTPPERAARESLHVPRRGGYAVRR